MNFTQIHDLDNAHVVQTYARNPVAIERGEGAALYSPDNKRYIDFASGIGVNSVGYAHPKWIAAVSEQAARLAHTSNLFYTETGVKLAARLCELSGMDGAFFANSGAEANEGVIKLARKYSFDKYGRGRDVIVTLGGSFHGRTVTALSATGQDKFHNYFFPFTEGFRYAEAGNITALEEQGNDVCAVLLETIQGEGGVLPLDGGYLQAVEKLCRERDWLLLIDEVQTGIGRTGTFFSYQQFGLQPDAVSFAKGIAGGLPLGGFLVNKKTRGVLSSGTHGSTFGMNPICCAAALSVIDILVDGGVIADAERKGRKIRDFAEKLGFNTRGAGLMIGLQVENPSALARKLIENGLLALTAGTDAVRFLPPLTISDSELDEGLEILRKTI